MQQVGHLVCPWAQNGTKTHPRADQPHKNSRGELPADSVHAMLKYSTPKYSTLKLKWLKHGLSALAFQQPKPQHFVFLTSKSRSIFCSMGTAAHHSQLLSGAPTFPPAHHDHHHHLSIAVAADGKHEKMLKMKMQQNARVTRPFGFSLWSAKLLLNEASCVKMYSNEMQQGLWHYFLSSMKVLIPGLSKTLFDMCLKEYLLPGI